MDASDAGMSPEHYTGEKYGLAPGDYERMLEAQGGVCAICKREPRSGGRKLHVDHCHRTKKVRGLLCWHCNVGLGEFGDSPERLESASLYLKDPIGLNVIGGEIL